MSVELKTSQQLIDESQGLVRSIAQKIHRRLPPHISFDDVLSYGQVGLAQAARSFRAGQGTSFATFAYYRIRGAIYDGMAKMSWTSRAVYNRVKAEEAAAEVLQQSNDQNPSAGNKQSEALWLVQTTERLAVSYLASTSRDGSPGAAELVDEKTDSPEEQATKREAVFALNQLLESLAGEDRKLIQLKYFDGLSLTDVADKLGKSKSWASRRHTAILDQMARSLQSVEPY
ncbi:MAG: RNA polymerase sigma factor for flagellar operon FliA [Pirellulaceae bacterium]|jgi:RNA polymerase sigma factor for flagellar operon FliA